MRCAVSVGIPKGIPLLRTLYHKFMFCLDIAFAMSRCAVSVGIPEGIPLLHILYHKMTFLSLNQRLS